MSQTLNSPTRNPKRQISECRVLKPDLWIKLFNSHQTLQFSSSFPILIELFSSSTPNPAPKTKHRAHWCGCRWCVVPDLYIHIFICINVHIYTYIYIYIDMYICIYVYPPPILSIFARKPAAVSCRVPSGRRRIFGGLGVWAIWT
jgi:hypothetical protein